MLILPFPLILLAYVGQSNCSVFPIRRAAAHTTALNSSTPGRVGMTYNVQVNVDGQDFWLWPDTGSSDLWIPVSDFQCVSPLDNSEIAQAECQFGKTYAVPETTEYVANETFGVQYGSGIALGRVAYANVTVAGITVERQKIGLVDRTNDIGDGLQSGIFGLGFPALTSAHPGTTLDNATLLLNRAVYDPVFVSMYKQGLVESWYSFAIRRPSLGSNSTFSGWLGLGELPPVAHLDDWISKPIDITQGLPDELTGGQNNNISLMTLTVDGIVMNTTSGTVPASDVSSFQAVVDTGNNQNLFPLSIAKAIVAGFQPPPTLDEETNFFIVDCNATAPEVGVVLDGHTFWLKSPDDLIFQQDDGTCYSSISGTGEEGDVSLNFLGGAFLRNVISVFDIGKEEMRFATAVYNESPGMPEFPGAAGRSSRPALWCVGVILVIIVLVI